MSRKRTIYVSRLNGEELEFAMGKRQRITDLKRKLARHLGVDTKERQLELALGDATVNDANTYIEDLPSERLTLITKKLVVVRKLVPNISGKLKYWAGGVLAQDGSVYFAPYYMCDICHARLIMFVRTDHDIPGRDADGSRL